MKSQKGIFQVRWFEQLDSTNTRLVEHVCIDPGVASGTVWAARTQTAGRGRLDRKWVSPSEGNLLFSFFHRTSADLSRLPSLTMAMAIAVDEMLHGFKIHSSLKWPNDIQVRGRKIAGLLAERAGGVGVVIGVGLNVNMTAGELARIDQPATSMNCETGLEWSPESLLEILLTDHLPLWLNRWEAGGFSCLRERWTQGCGGLNAPVSVRDGERRISGKLAGFGDNGELLLALPDGGIQTVWAGDLVFY